VPSRLEPPAGGGARGQPGCDVRRRPPGRTATVSLLTTSVRSHRRAAGDGYLRLVRQRAPCCRRLFVPRLLTRHPGTSARFPQMVTTQVEAISPPYAVFSLPVYEQRFPVLPVQAGCWIGSGAWDSRADAWPGGRRGHGIERQRLVSRTISPHPLLDPRLSHHWPCTHIGTGTRD
jgi:hypothetical protein